MDDEFENMESWHLRSQSLNHDEIAELMEKYLTKLRMNEAKCLLLSSPEMEVQKIGELVGYKNAFYFSRAFKTYTGMHPSEFRTLNEK